jgi:hypothetical protein
VVSSVVTANGTVTQPPRSTITADDPNGFVLHATFVETNRFDFPEIAQQNVDIALLYWRETTGAQVLARGVLVDGNNRWTEPVDLSAEAGIRHPWTPNKGDWTGDYMKGAFQYADDKGHFGAVWPVPVNRALRDGGARDAAEYCPEGQDAAAQSESNQIGAGSLQIARTCARRESRPPGSLSGAPALAIAVANGCRSARRSTASGSSVHC